MALVELTCEGCGRHHTMSRARALEQRVMRCSCGVYLRLDRAAKEDNGAADTAAPHVSVAGQPPTRRSATTPRPAPVPAQLPAPPLQPQSVAVPDDELDQDEETRMFDPVSRAGVTSNKSLRDYERAAPMLEFGHSVTGSQQRSVRAVIAKPPPPPIRNSVRPAQEKPRAASVVPETLKSPDEPPESDRPPRERPQLRDLVVVENPPLTEPEESGLSETTRAVLLGLAIGLLLLFSAGAGFVIIGKRGSKLTAEKPTASAQAPTAVVTSKVAPPSKSASEPADVIQFENLPTVPGRSRSSASRATTSATTSATKREAREPALVPNNTAEKAAPLNEAPHHVDSAPETIAEQPSKAAPTSEPSNPLDDPGF